MPKKIFWEYRLVALGTMAWLVVCQFLFVGVQHTLGDQVVSNIQNQFRSELDYSNFHYLSRAVLDFERSGAIGCTFLTKLNPSVVILGHSNKNHSCSGQRFLLDGEEFEVSLKTLNGDEYNLVFVSRNNFLFYLSVWSFRLLGILLLGLGFYSYQLSKESFELKSKNERALAHERETLSKQVAHDIRSPLSALTMVMGTLKEVPEEKRILIRNATQRINDIANDLLQKGQKNDQLALSVNSQANLDHGYQQESQKLTTEFIPALIDILVSEKRMQYREYAELEIEADLKDSFGAFAKINSNELKRVVSNLINNAVEAFNNHQGLVKVGVKKISLGQTEQVEIVVKDNGKGIPPHILAKLGQMGVSHGKEGTQSGSGLGVYHAKKTVESFGGTFQIESQEGQGTLIKMTLPLTASPTWFADKVDLTGKKYLVSLDDDISIHQIWSGRLQSAGDKDIEHIRFQSGDAFVQFVNSNLNKLSQTLFLVDYELLNQTKTGLDLIEDLGIEKYSILVTSRYEEASIQSRAAQLRLSLLPKTLAGFVPFEMTVPKEHYDLCLIDDDTQLMSRPIDTNSSSKRISEEKVRYDLCLIDDDQELIGAVWAAVAAEKGLKIRLFATPQAFMAEADKITRQTPIYIDVSLGHGVSGLDVAHDIHKMGFTEINLATAYEADSVEVPGFIKRVVGKDFPSN